MVLATLDVSSFCRNIPQTEGIYVVSRLYDLRELLRLILEENSFKFNDIFSLWDISMRQEVSNFVSCGYKGSNNSVGLVTKGEDKRYRQESELKQQSQSVFNMATALQKVLAM